MIDALEPYARTKAVELPYLCSIPEHWDIRYLRSLARSKITNGVGVSANAYRDDWPRYVRITDIAGPRQLRETNRASLSPEVAGPATLSDGDLVLAAVGATFGKSLLYKRPMGNCCYAGFLVKVSPSDEVLPEFLSHWTQSDAYWDQVNSRVIQSTIQNFSASKYKSLRVPLPPIAEQLSIVRFLDHSNLKINRAIAAKRKTIGLLNEQKQAIIHQAVTRGLDPTVPLKPSGIPWLGEIPAHWQVKRLGSLLKERGEVNRELQVTDVLSLLRGRGVIPYAEKGNIGNKMSEDIRRYKIVHHDDIVMNSMNVIIGSVGISRYVGCLSPVYYVLERRSINDSPEYLNALFQVEPFHKSLIRIGKGILAHRMRIPMELLKAELFPYPEPTEQRAIMEFVVRSTEAMSSAADALEREAQLLIEYRTRLTSDVVTGKLDVREAAKTLAELDDDLAELVEVPSSAVEDELELAETP